MSIKAKCPYCNNDVIIDKGDLRRREIQSEVHWNTNCPECRATLTLSLNNGIVPSINNVLETALQLAERMFILKNEYNNNRDKLGKLLNSPEEEEFRKKLLLEIEDNIKAWRENISRMDCDQQIEEHEYLLNGIKGADLISSDSYDLTRMNYLINWFKIDYELSRS